MFEGHGQFVLEVLSVLLEFLNVAIFQHQNRVLLLLFELVENVIPLFVEGLIFLNVSVFNLFSLLGLL